MQMEKMVEENSVIHQRKSEQEILVNNHVKDPRVEAWLSTDYEHYCCQKKQLSAGLLSFDVQQLNLRIRQLRL